MSLDRAAVIFEHEPGERAARAEWGNRDDPKIVPHTGS
jgi:hypothetical protein